MAKLQQKSAPTPDDLSSPMYGAGTSVLPVQAVPSYPCEVVDNPDGSLTVTITVDAAYVKRLKSRAYLVPLDKFLWESILRPALLTSIY